MIVLIGGEKGGPGKTTLAVNLAAMRGGDLLLIDTDRQQSASYWCEVRDDRGITPRVASVQKFEKAVRTETLALKSKYNDIIIDAGGRDSTELRSALLVADKAILPLRPSQFDLWTLERLDELVGIAKEFNEGLVAHVVINQASTHPGVREVRQAKELIAEFENLELYDNYICERIAFRRAAIQGLSVCEYKPTDLKAVEEMRGLYNDIFETA